MTWAPPTHASLAGLGPADHAEAPCDRCPRRAVKTDMLTAVGHLPPALRARLGLTTEAFICDACVARLLIYERRVPYAELAAAHGAPPEVVAAHAATDRWWAAFYGDGPAK